MSATWLVSLLLILLRNLRPENAQIDVMFFFLTVCDDYFMWCCAVIQLHIKYIKLTFSLTIKLFKNRFQITLVMIK